MAGIGRQGMVQAILWMVASSLSVHGLGHAGEHEQGPASTILKACLKPIDTVLGAKLEVEVHGPKGQDRHYSVRLERNAHEWLFHVDKPAPSLRLNIGETMDVAIMKTGSWHSPAPDDVAATPWLLDLAFLVPRQVSLERYQTRSDMKMAGKRYLTLVADGLNEGEFGQASLSVTLSGPECRLLRAVYFDRTGKLWKKVFYHWQSVQGHTAWKNMHVEDARTLGRTIYRFSDFRFRP